MRKALWTILVLAACGGTTVAIPDSDGGGSSSSSSGSSGGGGTDAGKDGAQADGGTCSGTFECFCGTPYCDNGTWRCPNGCGDSCAQMQAQLDTMRAQLRTCCPTCKSIQCQNTATDVCCDITVNSADTSAFDALVQKYRDACAPVCPRIACPIAPSGICDPSQSDPQNGLCR